MKHFKNKKINNNLTCNKSQGIIYLGPKKFLQCETWGIISNSGKNKKIKIINKIQIEDKTSGK